MSTQPKIDLTTFFLSVSSAAYLSLGFDEHGGQPDLKRVDLDMARQNIDLLELMKEKTQGNRSAEEERLLSHLLMEIQLRYVETEKKVNA